MRVLVAVFLIVITLVIAACASMLEQSTDLEEVVSNILSTSPNSSDIVYHVTLPRGEGRESDPWPVLIFLHGSGERGDDIDKVKIHGPIHAARNDPDFPFLIVAPLLSANAVWSPESIIKVIDDVRSKWKIDPDRLYLTGLSLGGHGTWNTAVEYPKLFAAIAPISGYGNPVYACKLINMPVWSFHGVSDTIVKAIDNQNMVDAVRTCGGQPGLTLYPDVGHDAWTITYENKQLYEWLLSHKRIR